MILKGIQGLQEKNEGGYVVDVMATHSNDLSSGWKGYHEHRASYSVKAANTAKPQALAQ